jgi:hypothetical protein
MHYPRQPGVYALAAVFFTGVLGYKVWQVRGKVRRLRQGRDGEREVAEVLEEIVQSGSYAVHDIPADGFNLDHVVTKTWSKPNGQARIEFDGEQLSIGGIASAKDRSGIPPCRRRAQDVPSVVCDEPRLTGGHPERILHDAISFILKEIPAMVGPLHWDP